MTIASVQNAAVTSISGAGLGLTTVSSAGGARLNRPTPDACPSALLYTRGGTRERLFDFGLDRDSQWSLYIDLWRYDVDLSDEDGFTNLVDGVAKVFRDNPQLGGAADTAKSQLQWLYPDQAMPRPDRVPYNSAGAGGVLRYGRVRVHIREVLRS